MNSNTERKGGNITRRFEVTKKDLPLHCPMEGTDLWISQPRVYWPSEDSGSSKCPDCGADYILVNKD